MGKNLRVHCINSAWLAGDDHDNGFLRVLPILSHTLDKYGKKKSNILLMHHPINWMNKSESNEISRLIEKNIDAVFYGHMHEFEQSVTINFSNDITLKLQAGTIDLRNPNAGYSIISLNSSNSFKYGRVIYRKYEPEEEIYQPWIERIEHGFSDFSLDKGSIFDSSKFCEKSSELLDKIEYSHLINTGRTSQEKLKLSDIFIQPKLVCDDGLKQSMPEIGKISSIDEIQGISGCILISGTEQQGRTTLLKKIQLSILKNQANYNLQSIVFYIDLSIEYASSNKILNQLLMNYEDNNLQTSFDTKLKSSIKDGNAVILIDNYDKCTEACLSSINQFISNNDTNKFIISSETDNNVISLKKIISTYQGDIYNAIISDIARCDIREIISKRPIKSPLHSDDELFHNLIKVVDNSQLPHNHFVYSILLLIYEEKSNLVGILNEADIIENYIEILLHKHCVNSNTKYPTYKVLLHLLGYICSKLIYDKKSFLSHKELTKHIMAFENLTFHDFEIENYISPILNSGLIYKSNSSNYEFSNSCFLYYFSAYFMNTDDNLKDFVFADHNYLHLEKIVEYYASINSSNFNVLRFFENNVINRRNELSLEIKESQKIDIESLNIDNIPSISLLDFASSSEGFEESIDSFNVEQSKYDEDLDSAVPLRGKKEKDSSIERINADMNSENVCKAIRYRRELSLLSKVFRNTELVMDPQEVMRIFDYIIDSYIFLIKAELASLNDSVVLPLLVPTFEKQISAGDITQKDKDKIFENLKLALQIIRAFVPNSIEQLLANNLSTKKPRFNNILNKKLINTNSDGMEEMLIRFLLLDIERGNFKHHIKELKNIQGSIASSALFLKLLQLNYSRHDFKSDEKNYVQHIMTELVKTNRSVSQTAINKLSSIYQD
ncbi:hypothetical protein AB6C66_07340 [Vibrio splendidus]|uniref:hypothetical protein n=1 Tax=Vibrio splendidus TaxID=29497 RepID=UPI00035F4AAC|nr:hypothetical protein [Vibrio splendidus]OEF71360.1 hypothetical protein A148_03450 [Vibrio splendidus 1F-157]